MMSTPTIPTHTIPTPSIIATLLDLLTLPTYQQPMLMEMLTMPLLPPFSTAVTQPMPTLVNRTVKDTARTVRIMYTPTIPTHTIPTLTTLPDLLTLPTYQQPMLMEMLTMPLLPPFSTAVTQPM